MQFGASFWNRSGTTVVATTLVVLASMYLSAGGAGATQSWGNGYQVATGGGQQISAVACDTAGTLCTAVDQDGREVTFDPASPGSPTPYLIGRGNGVSDVVCNSGWTLCLATDFAGNLVTFDPTSPPTNENFTPIDDMGGGLQGEACDGAFDVCVAVDNSGNEVTFDPSNLAGRSTYTIDTNSLRSVACPADNLCVTVDNNGNEVTFDPSSPGTPTAYPLGMSSFVSAVSCTSMAQCTAVDQGGDQLTFNPNGGGSAPSTISSSTPNSGMGGLSGLACPSATQCTATGGGDQVTFDPATGSVATHGGPHGVDFSGGGFNGVACPSTSQCTGVDNNGDEVTFNPTPSSGSGVGEDVVVDGPGRLTALSCLSASQCTTVDAVGEEVTFNPSDPSTPISFNHTLDADGNGLNGVSCGSTGPSNSQCTAVDNNGNEVTFNPESGSIVSNGGPLSIDSNHSLNAVACPSATECTAVDNNGTEVTFDPESGSITTNGGPFSIDSGQQLRAVACPSTSECVAVDMNGNEVTYNPSSGTSSGPNSIDFMGLNGVSCPSTDLCAGVDGNGNVITFDPANVSGTTSSTQVNNFGGLQGVSCPSIGYCVAIAGGGNEVFEIDLQTAPVSAIDDFLQGATSLRAVDCSSLTQCEAVDQVSQLFSSSLNEVTASSPASFGMQALDTAGPPESITITNPTKSPVTLSLTTAGADPDDFFITSSSTCPATLSPGAECTVDVRFWPSASGARTATLQNTDVFSGAQYAIATLSGTGGSTIQGAPTAGSVTVTESASFTAQLTVAPSHGDVTYTQSTGSADLTVSASGLVSTTGTLAANMYTATGTTDDPAGEMGSFTFTLTVTAVTIAPVSATGSVTVAKSSDYSVQLTATGNGPVTFTQTGRLSNGRATLTVSSSGLVTTTGTLSAIPYEVTGTTSDAYGDAGSFSFRLTVVGKKLVVGAPTSVLTTIAKSSTYTHQLSVTGSSGPVTYAKLSGVSGGSKYLKISKSGLIRTTGTLAAGTYTLHGIVSDNYNELGYFSFTLTVKK